MLSPLDSRETTGSKEEYDNLYTTDCKPNTPFKQASSIIELHKNTIYLTVNQERNDE